MTMTPSEARTPSKEATTTRVSEQRTSVQGSTTSIVVALPPHRPQGSLVCIQESHMSCRRSSVLLRASAPDCRQVRLAHKQFQRCSAPSHIHVHVGEARVRHFDLAQQEACAQEHSFWSWLDPPGSRSTGKTNCQMGRSVFRHCVEEY